MDQTGIFGLCENSTKLQCSGCNSFTEIWKIYCSCGRNLKYKRSPATKQKDDYDFSSIPGYNIIKKNSSREPKHGRSERHIVLLKAKDMPKSSKEKQKRKPSDTSLTLASRWRTPKNVGTYRYRRRRNQDVQPNRFGETRLFSHERIQDAKHCVISINAEGPQLPRQLRPDYAAAKRECQWLQDEYMAETKQLYRPIHPSKQMRQNPTQQFEGSEDYDHVVGRKTGWKWYKEQQGNLPHTLSSSSSSWQNWNSWWWHSSKPDEGLWVKKKFSMQFRIAGT